MRSKGGNKGTKRRDGVSENSIAGPLTFPIMLKKFPCAAFALKLIGVIINPLLLGSC